MSEPFVKLSPSAVEVAEVAFRQYARSLHGYLTRRIHRGADVPNLTMEIYERFLRTQQGTTVVNPRAFLFRIARHVVADAHRLEASRPLIIDSDAVDIAGQSLELTQPDDAGEQLDSERELQRVREAMKQLSPVHQAVLWLAVHDGLAHKEIARRMNLSVATVGLYVCESRARLRVLLDRI